MNIFNLELVLAAWPAVLAFYFFFFWFTPMIGMLTNPYVKEHNCYWKGVFVVAGTFHVSGVLATLLFLYLEPYMFPGA